MTTEERLEKLEKELMRGRRFNGWLLVVVGLAVVGVALAWTFTMTTPIAQAQEAGTVPKVIRANKFILDDENGNARIIIAMFEDEPAIAMLDENGKPCLQLKVDKKGVGPTIRITDENGNIRIGIGVDKELSPGIMMFDENRKHRIGIGVNKDGPRLRLYDENGKQSWSAL